MIEQYIDMTEHILLIIADDLTGGADTGVQFAKRGFRTILLSLQPESFLDLNGFLNHEVVVVNTGSRNLSPQRARSAITALFSMVSCRSFPFIYKKIDSTLRGNIGPELDTLIDELGISMAFMAPSFPALQRTVVGGIMLVRGMPLSLTDASRDVASPVNESNVHKLLQAQTDYKVGWIDLPHVSAGGAALSSAVRVEQNRGSRILAFDAVTREDLRNIAELAFSMDPKPMLVGSAGLAGEISCRMARRCPQGDDLPSPPSERFFPRRCIVISGSTSSVTLGQLRFAECRGIVTVELPSSIVAMPMHEQATLIDKIAAKSAAHIEKGHLILKSFKENPMPQPLESPTMPEAITRILGRIARRILDKIHAWKQEMLLILTGGDTAMGVLNALGIEALEIKTEVLEGISLCSVSGGRWKGLRVVTKAGAFGNEDALVKIIEQTASGNSTQKL